MYRQPGQTHIPLRVNSAGMIPLIFAYVDHDLPGARWRSSFGVLDDGLDRRHRRTSSPALLQSRERPFYWVLYLRAGVVFTFFYTMVIFQQQNLAENLQKHGGFIPGIRPGRPTAGVHHPRALRITWAGRIFLGLHRGAAVLSRPADPARKR